MTCTKQETKVLWPYLIQKAYAKMPTLNDSTYRVLKSGYAWEAFNTLTGCPAEIRNIKTMDSTEFTRLYSQQHTMTIGNAGHAFAVIDLKKTPGEGETTTVTIYDTNSLEDYSGKENSNLHPNCGKQIPGKPGVFEIEYSDLQKNFGRLVVGYLKTKWKRQPTPMVPGKKRYILQFASSVPRIHVGVFQQSRRRRRTIKGETETYPKVTMGLQEFHTNGKKPDDIPMIIVHSSGESLDSEMAFFSTPKDREIKQLALHMLTVNVDAAYQGGGNIIIYYDAAEEMSRFDVMPN